jgi:hypothetical protein
MNHNQAQEIANENNLGQVYFEFRTAQNTGGQIEVGYVTVNGSRELFCKRQSNTNPDQFYLCNQFRTLEEK